MNSLLIGMLSSLGLGLFAVVHPCSMSTNIAAVSLLFSLNRYNKRFTISLFFVLGEIVTYALLGILLSFGILKIPVIASILQNYIFQLLGPFLIVIGMMVSGLLFSNQRTLKIYESFFEISPRYGNAGVFLAGCLIALSFCPMSAATFFGVLIPLATTSGHVLLFPILFGFGSLIPLLGIVILISKSTSVLGRSFFMKERFEKIFGKLVGIFMIFLGIFMSLRYVFEIV